MPDTKQKPELSSPMKEIVELIADKGPVSIAQFMELAAGYYYAAQKPFGVEGDFTTAPEISQMFGEMIAAWLVDIWMQEGQPDKVHLIELGPGNGTLMADIMRALATWPALRESLSLHLIETSPRLRQQQADALKTYRPVWHDRLEDAPAGMSFIIANEFFDALPIYQFEKKARAWVERRVGYDADSGNFYFGAGTPDFDLTSIMPPAFLNAEEGSVFEISPASLAVLEAICHRIDKAGGASLIIDYGHTAAALGDTLQAVRQHRYADVLADPGAQDITAHVDFGTLSAVAQQYVAVHGPVTQGEFLTNLGIRQRAAFLSRKATAAQQKDIETALYRLTAPEEMGGLFKVMGLTSKKSVVHVSGFNEEKK